MTSHSEDERWLARLPHRPPFRFLTDGIQLKAGVDGEANWRVSGNESFFSGHFPGAPMVPGVLMAEALAQLSGLVLFGDVTKKKTGGEGDLVPARLAHVDVRFLTAVVPPAVLQLRSRLVRDLGGLNLFDVEARVADAKVARGQLTLVVSAAANARGDA